MLRPYQSSDLSRVQTFIGECLHLTKLCGYHPGDVVHWMSNSQRGEHLEKTFWLYEKAETILALAYIPFNKWSDYALISHLNVSETLEFSLLKECEAFMLARFPDKALSMNVALHNSKRIRCLEALGYTAKESDIVVDLCLLDSISESMLPQGFMIRSVAGEHEAGLLAEVHSSAFGSSWTESEYRKVMRTPGFDSERELVMVAPDGRFASFLVYWLDPITHTGLFEPVGCHQDFQRKGLTKALMIEGMRRMRHSGMTRAMVGHLQSNEAATKLYTSVGFKECFRTFDFVKTLEG